MTNSVTFPPALGGDGSTVDDSESPTTGLDGGGHAYRFIPALQQFIAVCQTVVTAIAGQAVITAEQVASIVAAGAGQISAVNSAGAGQISLAQEQAAAAAASALTALNAPGTSAASTSSLTIATGDKTLTIQTGKSLVAGMYVVIADSAAPTTNTLFGQIASYNSGTGVLVVSVSAVTGSGTLSSWIVSLSGPTGTVISRGRLFFTS